MYIYIYLYKCKYPYIYIYVYIYMHLRVLIYVYVEMDEEGAQELLRVYAAASPNLNWQNSVTARRLAALQGRELE